MKCSWLSLTLASLALAACTGPVIMGSDAAIVYATKPGQEPPADTASQIPQHESWCYSTMGDSQCYAHAQNVPGDRLINVDPQSRYPLDPAAYRDAVAGKMPANAAPVMLEPAAAMPVEKAPVKDEASATDAADVRVVP